MNHSDKSISFLWTSAPLIAGAKIVTRREWSPDYASRRGGRLLASLRLTQKPRLEAMKDMPDGDYEGEGFAWLHSHPEFIPLAIGGQRASRDDFSFDAFESWRSSGGYQFVVRFEVYRILAPQFLDDLLLRLMAARPQLSLF